MPKRCHSAHDKNEQRTREIEDKIIQMCIRDRSSIVTPANRQENSSIRSFSPMKSEIGCVIMASGLAKRFGSNKLLAEFEDVYKRQVLASSVRAP